MIHVRYQYENRVGESPGPGSGVVGEGCWETFEQGSECRKCLLCARHHAELSTRSSHSVLTLTFTCYDPHVTDEETEARSSLQLILAKPGFNPDSLSLSLEPKPELLFCDSHRERARCLPSPWPSGSQAFGDRVVNEAGGRPSLWSQAARRPRVWLW